MAKTGRNDPCPCGSGKKYKRCCLAVHQAEQAAAQRPPEPEPRLAEPRSWESGAPDLDDYEELDRLSNRVPQLIGEGRLDEAEEVCQQLLHRYPDVSDGVERLGHVHEARGDLPKAAAHYRRAATFIREQGDPTDEHAAWLGNLADRLVPP
jgi:tetratricopeptide (TPR) repeat protein